MTTKVTSNVLNNTSVTPGTYGSSSQTPTIAVDAQGRITSATNTTISTISTSVNTGNWTIFESGGKLFFAHGGVNKFSMDSSGNFIAVNNVTAAGTP